MQTPNTPRGLATERFMRIWRDQNPDADPSAYNREWEKVYAKLEGTFSDERLAPNAAWDAVAGTTDPHPTVFVEHPVKQRPRRLRRKHAAPTKGAFGKPKLLKKR